MSKLKHKHTRAAALHVVIDRNTEVPQAGAWLQNQGRAVTQGGSRFEHTTSGAGCTLSSLQKTHCSWCWTAAHNIVSLAQLLYSVFFFFQVEQIWGRKKARLFHFVGYIPMGCCSLKNAAAWLWGRRSHPPGLLFVLYGWPDYIL